MFSWFQRGRFDVQPVMEAGAPLVLVTKAGVGIEKTAEKNEQQNKDTRLFYGKNFHRKILFYYVMPGRGRGAERDVFVDKPFFLTYD